MTRKSKEEVWECPICNERLGDGFKFGDHVMRHMQLKKPASQTPPEHDEGSATTKFPGHDRTPDPNCELCQADAKRVAGTPSQHVHSFVIPVEWRTIPQTYHGVVDESGPHGYDTPAYMSVTKLRCNYPGCTEETER